MKKIKNLGGKTPSLWNKSLRILRFTFLFLLVGFMQLSASMSSVSTKNLPKTLNSELPEVFDTIEYLSEYLFAYSPKMKNIDYEVTIDQQHTVSGNVTDESGLPLPGVTVLIKGTSQGTITNADGNYFISSIPEDAILVFSFVGMRRLEVKVGNQTSVNISMELDTIGIEEVVAIGYGTQRKGNLTGAISSVNSEALTRSPVASTSNTLAGRLPGLISVQRSGVPGGDAASLSIRGFGSPLVIVDGVEMNFNNIDPNQIESISILKDGSASIYGARAGDGVILVTSKRGVVQKPMITINTSYTFQGIVDMPKPASAGQYAEMEREKWINAGRPADQAPFSENEIEKYYDGTDPQYPNTNWYKKTIRDWAPQQQHNISVRGGNEKIKYYGFFGYLDQETVWRKNGGGYSRYNIQSNIDAKITNNLTLQLDLSSIITDRSLTWRGQHAGAHSVWQDFWNTLPIYPSELPDPTKLSYANGGGTGGIHIITNRELAGYSDSKNQNLNGTFVLNYDFESIKGLSIKAFVSYLQNYDKGKYFTRPINFYTYDVASDAYSLAGSLGTKADLSASRSDNNTLTRQLSASYNRVFDVDHQFNYLLLYEAIDYKSEWLTASRANFITPAIEELFAGSVDSQSNNGTRSEMGRASYIGRLNYSFKNKYLIETILRADASAKFSPEKRWGYFPSFSFGWRINEENFMNGFKNLDNLKLRLSYGSSGQDNVGNFQFLSGYQLSGRYLIGSETIVGLNETGIENPNLTWEKINIYNIGTDFSFWNRKIFGEVDFFFRERFGIIGTKLLSLPTTFGANLPQENLNSLNNRGFEFSLGTSGKINSMHYDIRGNISWSRAKWIHYEEPIYSDPNQVRIEKKSGQWTDIYYGLLSDGLFSSQEEINSLEFEYGQGNESLKPGDIKYININGDEVLDWRDQVEIGKGTTPQWMFGSNLNLKYKNIDVSALFQGAFAFYSYVTLDHGNFLVPEEIYNLRWTENKNNPAALVPRMGGSESNTWYSDYWYKRADYVRLKELSIGYNVPTNFLLFNDINQLRIYFSGTNLFTFSQLKKYGIDPEAPSGWGAYYYPQQKTLTFGLNLTF